MSIIPLRDGGRVVREGDEWDISEEAARSVATYVEAVRDGEQERFIEQNYSGPPNPSDAEVIVDLIYRPFMRRSLETFQCDYCGRVWIEDILSDGKFRSFKPDAAWRGIYEVFPAGFLAYEAESSFYNCHLVSIEHQENDMMVTFENWKAQKIKVLFTGVTSTAERIAEYPDRTVQGLYIQSLSKWEAEPPSFKYVFANDSQFEENESDYLAVVARGFEIVEDDTSEGSEDSWQNSVTQAETFREGRSLGRMQGMTQGVLEVS